MKKNGNLLIFFLCFVQIKGEILSYFLEGETVSHFWIGKIISHLSSAFSSVPFFPFSPSLVFQTRILETHLIQNAQNQSKIKEGHSSHPLMAFNGKGKETNGLKGQRSNKKRVKINLMTIRGCLIACNADILILRAWNTLLRPLIKSWRCLILNSKNYRKSWRENVGVKTILNMDKLLGGIGISHTGRRFLGFWP